MSAAKTAVKRSGPALQGDTNVKQTTMGMWTPRSERYKRSAGGKPKGRATRRLLIPPPGGWKGA